MEGEFVWEQMRRVMEEKVQCFNTTVDGSLENSRPPECFIMLHNMLKYDPYRRLLLSSLSFRLYLCF